VVEERNSWNGGDRLFQDRRSGSATENASSVPDLRVFVWLTKSSLVDTKRRLQNGFRAEIEKTVLVID